MNKQELFKTADEYKKIMNEYKPFTKEQISIVDHYFRSMLTYSSNALAGSPLTLAETKELLEKGTIVEGNRAYAEAIGHAEAYDYMLEGARVETLVMSEELINRLHEVFYRRINEEEAGAYRQISGYVEETNYLPPVPEELEHLMKHFISQMEISKKMFHPLEYAAICHKRIIDIRPYKEGNEQIARLLMNLILVNEGYGVVTICPDIREEYMKACKAAQHKSMPNVEPLINLIARCVIASEKKHCELLGIR